MAAGARRARSRSRAKLQHKPPRGQCEREAAGAAIRPHAPPAAGWVHWVGWGGVGWCSSSPAVPARRRGYVRLQGSRGGALDLLPFIIGRRITNPDPAYPVTRETLKRRGSLRRTRPKHHQWRAVVLFITAPVFCLKVARRAGARVSV
jgi:hypothetical protein